MSLILDPDNFENGIFKIPVNQDQENDLQDYIDLVEEECLPRLFGKELYDLFIIDFNAPVAGFPTDPRFVFIYDPFIYQDDQFGFVESKGIEEMLKGMVYLRWVRDLQNRLTTVGIEENDGENSINISAVTHDCNRRYNKSIQSYKAMQLYMDEIDPDLYPEYDGVAKRYNHIF